MKDVVEISEIMKGCAHPRRIRIMMVLKSSRSRLSLDELSEKAEVPYKTAAVHVGILQESGLVSRSRYGQRVEHALTDLGANVLEFMSGL